MGAERLWDINEEKAIKAMKEMFRPAYLETNIRAFELGKRAFKSVIENR